MLLNFDVVVFETSNRDGTFSCFFFKDFLIFFEGGGLELTFGKSALVNVLPEDQGVKE